jgi:hypothetical protein
MGKDGHKAERYALSIANCRDKLSTDAYELAHAADFSAFPPSLIDSFEEHVDEYTEIDGQMVRKTCAHCSNRARRRVQTDNFEIKYVCDNCGK